MMMRFSAAYLAILAVAFGPSGSDAQTNSCTATSTDDIISLACDSANSDIFGTLCTALQDTGIDGSITKLNGVYTVFAPFNSAFDAAGRRIGNTLPQKQATLQYHIVNGEFTSPACGDELNTLLFWGGVQQTVEFDCTAGAVTGVTGDINLPLRTSADPLIRSIAAITTGDPPRIDACNGVIYPINNVLGFDPIQYNWQFQPCLFNDPTCVRPVYAKGSKGGVVVVQDTVGDLTFVNTYPTKASKSWGYFAPQQSFYANQWGPWAGGYGWGGNGWGGYGSYYGYYGKGYKAKGYGYGYGYGYGGGFGNGGYGYGYGAKGYGYGWRKNRQRRQLDAFEELDEMMTMEDVDAVYDEPEEEYSAGDIYYNYRKNRNLRRGQ